MAFAVGALLALALTSIALATHRRPGAGTPFRTALVTAYQPCPNPSVPSPNSTHVAPLALPSCTPPEPESSTLTMGSVGAGHAFARLDVFCTDGATPPCTPNDGNDTEDILVRATATDVRCAVGGIPNCTDPGSDYTGQLILRSIIRITDHLNGDPPDDLRQRLGQPALCHRDRRRPSLLGADELRGQRRAERRRVQSHEHDRHPVPNTVIEFQRGVVAVQNLQAHDSGPDGSVTPPAPYVCPPVCGSGDETKYLEQGDMYP